MPRRILLACILFAGSKTRLCYGFGPSSLVVSPSISGKAGERCQRLWRNPNSQRQRPTKGRASRGQILRSSGISASSSSNNADLSSLAGAWRNGAHTSTRRDPCTPFIVGVAGGTASGKTCVVERIVDNLADSSVAVLPQDCYYRNLNEAERKRAHASDFNFDHPNAFDFERIIGTLRSIRAGEPRVSVPKYDYVTHSVMPEEHNSCIETPSIVIFEGILAFHDPAVRSLLDMKIFVDTDADTRLSRRIRRDISERGRDLEGVLSQYERFVKPSFDAYCFPQRNYADVILPRGAENSVAIAMVVENLRTVLVEYDCECSTFASDNAS